MIEGHQKEEGLQQEIKWLLLLLLQQHKDKR